MNKFILKATDLDGYLMESDLEYLSRMNELYEQAMASFKILSTSTSEAQKRHEEDILI